jgi:hypothetical protein
VFPGGYRIRRDESDRQAEERAGSARGHLPGGRLCRTTATPYGLTSPMFAGTVDAMER